MLCYPVLRATRRTLSRQIVIPSNTPYRISLRGIIWRHLMSKKYLFVRRYWNTERVRHWHSSFPPHATSAPPPEHGGRAGGRLKRSSNPIYYSGVRSWCYFPLPHLSTTYLLEMTSSSCVLLEARLPSSHITTMSRFGAASIVEWLAHYGIGGRVGILQS
jgi:hypothetical protein